MAVIPAGQEELIAEMLGRGEALPGGCRFAGGQVAEPGIRATYACADREVVLELRHPRDAATAVARTAQFAIVPLRGTPPAGLVGALVSRIRWREGAFQRSWTGGPSAAETGLRIATVALPTAAALLDIAALAIALSRRRRQPPAVAGRIAVGVAVTVLRIAGLIAVVLIARRGTAILADPPEAKAAIMLGIVSIVALLWLTVAGFFGYDSARRSDWVGLVPFIVALGVRELFTLHSIQEIEIQFAQGPLDKHSVVYPLLQMFFAPLVSDPHAFTMHMNGVLGAVACLSMYLFVRQRLESRTAGVLCALFLATHPLVARFSPTDGPYSLLLAAWFSGLALLSTPGLGARALFGGVMLLGIAATVRIEGVVFLVASLLMLDPRVLIGGIRRHRLVATSALLAVAVLGAVQMYFVLRFNRGNVPALPTFGAAVGLVAANGRIFAALVAIGALSGFVIRRWFGLFAFVAMLVVIAPVVDSTQSIALHRLVPAFALQAMVAGIGAYALTAWVSWARRWRWLATVPGALAAVFVLVQHRTELTKPYVFTEEYELVRRHLAPGGVPARHCTLATCDTSLVGDADIHDFAQVVPGVKVLACHGADCLTELSSDECVYYVRSVACYFHPAGVPLGCASAGIGAEGEGLGCLSERSASFERSVELEPVEVRTLDVLGTFAASRRNYPQRAQIGLFRVRPKRVTPRTGENRHAPRIVSRR